MKDVFRSSCLPVILGHGKASFFLSMKLYAYCGLTSLLLDCKDDFLPKLNPFCKFLPILDDEYFSISSLKRIARENQDMTLLLIPCTAEFERFTMKNKNYLESDFIIISPEKAYSLKNLKLNLQ